MENLVKCPVCRGSKQSMKLGNIMGDCNKCNATGSVKMAVVEEDRKKQAEVLAKAKEYEQEQQAMKQVHNIAVQLNKPIEPTQEPTEVNAEVTQIIEATKEVKAEDAETEKRRTFYKRKALNK